MKDGLIKRLICVVCSFIIVLSLAACGTGFGSLKYKEVTDSDIPSETLIAQNSKFTLELDKTIMGVVLSETATGMKWGSTPIDGSELELDQWGDPVKKHPKVRSILSIECKDFERDEVNNYNSYTDAVKNGKVTYEKIKNGIVINYYFTDAKVMIPLKCMLTDFGVTLSVDPNDIQESESKVLSISIAPFFCGVKNDSENSYLFVPSGSGAVVGVESKSEQGDAYSAQIYGYDPAIDEVASVSTKESVRLNVFGSKTDDSAVCAIVDGGADSAWINVTSGSTTVKYSAVYATFQMRGYTNHVAELFSYESVHNVVYSKKMINKPISVTYSPLSGENADYSGMANIYRDYLARNYGLKKSAKDIPLNIRMLGGTLTTKSFVGVPYKTLLPTTTLTNAERIMSEIKKEIDGGFSVQLKGFGDSGIDIGKIAGNYALNKNLGSYNELKKLFEFSESKGIDLYFDFDIERFSKNSNGFSTFYDAATNAGEQKAVQYDYDIAVRNIKEETAYNLLSPANFKKAFDKVTKKISNYNFSGISLDTLSSVAYSDYTDKENPEFYSKNGFSTVADKVIKTAKSNNLRFMASSANLYSAVLADVITESPVTSEKSRVFLYDVPFYQMVFKGSVPITVPSINLSADSKLMILKAIESGSGLGYTVIDKWDNSLINSDMPYFYNSVFEEIKDGIFENSKELSKYYNKISGKRIVRHTVFDDGLRETVFENGVRVYVNYTENTLTTPMGEIPSYKYLITE